MWHEQFKSRQGRVEGRLTKLLQERLSSSHKEFHENKDEDKKKMNYYFRDFNLGMKINYIPNINIRKFDVKDSVTWIRQMEQFFDLHDVPHPQKVHIAYLYLDPYQFVWY